MRYAVRHIRLRWRMQFGQLKRREFITLLGSAAVAWPFDGLAQSPPKRPLIGFLGTNSKAAGARYYSRFAIGMRELGYLEGRDYGFEERYADGDLPRLPLLAEELATLKPDLIVASTTPGAPCQASSAPQPGLCTNSVRGMSMR